MSLTVDAIPHNMVKPIINIDILRQIEDDLDTDEKISVLFLMVEDYANAFADIIKLFQKMKTENVYIIVDYVQNHVKNWENKILEALCILNNREVIRKLGLSFDDLDLLYVRQINTCSRNINVVAKCLYKLCESLNENEHKLLLSYVKSDISNYEPLLDNIDYLELHMLYWLKSGYITISKDKKHKMTKLLKHLDKFENNKDIKIICLDLKKFENQSLHVDTHGTLGINDKNSLQSISLEELSLTERHSDYERKKLINNGLCIIINQMYFGRKYETRFGTRADCNNLSETFKTFGFKVQELPNLKKEEMLEKIQNISKDYGNNYDCLFLCILSHGYKGGIIASDEKEVSLEAIEGAICCTELKDIIKIVIIQACQGKTLGIINNCLTTDGLSDAVLIRKDLSQLTNFVMFMSTIQGFLSIRHKEQGTWFIQEFCRVFKAYGSQLTFVDCVMRIMKSVREKTGTVEGNHIAQLSEIRHFRLDYDFQLKRV